MREGRERETAVHRPTNDGGRDVGDDDDDDPDTGE